MPPDARQSPVRSNGEVLDLISVCGEEAVQSQLRSSRRNYDTYGQISRAMMERGHDQDTVQCRVKVKELQNAYHKAREANRCSSAAPVTCRFYKELDAILGGDRTSTPKTTMDNSESIAAQSSTRQEEKSGSRGAEEEGGPEPEDGSASLHACSQERFSSQEEGSNRSSRDRFITSSLDVINRPPSTIPSTPVLQHHERHWQSRQGSSSSRLTTVETPRVERIFSSFGLIHSKMRNCLGSEKAGNLVFLFQIMNEQENEDEDD
ncbi:Zinc finger and SCAN domain-containing protein 29 [Chelonia mydas]|uniref:Zinc finger and SCAN domain-containing protein 29 n=1 Tax=Chelonia mydas TaxID=8469 RepID=M7CET6_CHEMY|nr:Zinc finger and SCAN domain-containing protein 29 [Chelonia mydas]